MHQTQNIYESDSILSSDVSCYSLTSTVPEFGSHTRDCVRLALLLVDADADLL